MELLDGKTLREHIGGKPLDIPAALALTIQVADALDAGSRQRIIHRDIKPAQHFCDRTRPRQGARFGLCETVSAIRRHDAQTVDMLTRAGTAMGTVAYMSPDKRTARTSMPHRPVVPWRSSV